MSDYPSSKVICLDKHRVLQKKDGVLKKWWGTLTTHVALKTTFLVATVVSVICGFVLYNSSNFRAAALVWLIATCFMVAAWAVEHHQHKNTDLYKTED